MDSPIGLICLFKLHLWDISGNMDRLGEKMVLNNVYGGRALSIAVE